MTKDELEQLGREVVVDGRLDELRQYLGLSASFMAELLGVSPITYRAWQDKPDTRLWTNMAIKVGRWYDNALSQLEMLDVVDEDFRHLIPIQMAAPLLGLPQEVLLGRYREGKFDAVDLGMLGLWLHRDDFREMRRAA